VEAAGEDGGGGRAADVDGAGAVTASIETALLITGCVVFALGCAGVVLRRNPVAVLMSVELMINASILLLVLGSRIHNNVEGQSVGLLVLVLGAAEAVVGLALALAVFRPRATVDVDGPAEVQG
jgi:NADH-quinone oxidoreductase subunit K